MVFQKKETNSSSEPWNVAKGFVTFTVLFPTGELNKLIKVARFGAEHLEDAIMFENQPHVKAMARKEAILRIHSILMDTLISENRFAIKKKDTDDFEEYNKELMKLSDLLLGVTTTTRDTRNGSITEEINEGKFNQCLNMLIRIKGRMNVQLNNADLIFSTSDEVDLEAIKKEMGEA